MFNVQATSGKEKGERPGEDLVLFFRYGPPLIYMLNILALTLGTLPPLVWIYLRHSGGSKLMNIVFPRRVIAMVSLVASPTIARCSVV